MPKEEEEEEKKKKHCTQDSPNFILIAIGEIICFGDIIEALKRAFGKCCDENFVRFVEKW